MAQHMRLKHPEVEYNPNITENLKKETGGVKLEEIKREIKKK
jgi:hypothetical protein